MTREAPQHIYLLHGRGGSPAGTVALLDSALRKVWPYASYHRPLMPHIDPDVRAAVSVEYMQQLEIPDNALLVGVSLGGLVAAYSQERERPDFTVVAICAPIFADSVFLERYMNRRVALYSSADQVIADRITDWPRLAESFDLFWLADHNPDREPDTIAAIIREYVGGARLEVAVKSTCKHRSRTLLKGQIIQCHSCRQIIERRGEPGERVISPKELGPSWYVDGSGWVRKRS